MQILFKESLSKGKETQFIVPNWKKGLEKALGPLVFSPRFLIRENVLGTSHFEKNFFNKQSNKKIPRILVDERKAWEAE